MDCLEKCISLQKLEESYSIKTWGRLRIQVLITAYVSVCVPVIKGKGKEICAEDMSDFCVEQMLRP